MSGGPFVVPRDRRTADHRRIDAAADGRALSALLEGTDDDDMILRLTVRDLRITHPWATVSERLYMARAVRHFSRLHAKRLSRTDIP